MPKSKKFNKRTGRNYKKEYARYQGKPAQIKRRALRNAARRKMAKLGRVHKGDGKDVDHRKGIGGGNSSKNLRVVSKHVNRGFRRNSKGKNLGLPRRRK